MAGKGTFRAIANGLRKPLSTISIKLLRADDSFVLPDSGCIVHLHLKLKLPCDWREHGLFTGNPCSSAHPVDFIHYWRILSVFLIPFFRGFALLS